ncbi:unnamed protein product [Rotaria sordida]|uniref:Fork-head domain-containing protein n=1 Tax=Rotaria sordida TaxID=392033 RepID=A0A813PEW0_9BILA|nr:unnamed protein product [Rotaria sordida]
MIHNDPSDVLSLSDLHVGITDGSHSSMVKQHQSDSHQYLSNHHSDSSRSSSICSSSLSPKTSSSTAVTPTIVATAAAPPATVTAIFTDIDPQLAQHVEYELGLTKKNGNGSGTRKNAWGNLSYAELITKAITSSAEQRLTLSEIYDWMIKYVPFFRNKVDRISSAGWKNSIRHNLSLHNRFKRVQSEGTGKSSWWMINPDDKSTNGNSASSTGIKQPRRRLGQGTKSSAVPSITPKRLRTPRSTKASRALIAVQQSEQQHQTVVSQQIQPSDMSIASVYEAQQWTSQLETDNGHDHLYEQELYSTTVSPPTTNSNGNSTTCIQSTYTYDDGTTNYVGNTTSNNNNNTGDYSYHHPHHFHPHPHHSHTLYQHHHGSNYDTGSTNRYYHQQSVLNDHHSNPCSLPIDTYHTNNPGTYSLQQQQQQQQQQIDPNDEHLYLGVHSTSSHSSSSSLSSPTLTKNNNLLPSSSSGSSSSNYTHTHKSSSSGGYLHPTSNGTLTLYSHHHQHISHHPNSYHPDIETLLQLNTEDDDVDDDDFSTLVHHHGIIDDQQQLLSCCPNNNHNHQLHSHNDTSTSILRTVLNRPIVDMYNQQV